jgi:hypothetical protein
LLYCAVVCCGGQDDSDDEAELKAELERIRAERAAEAEKRAAEEEAKRQEAIRAEVLGGNPLMANGEVDFSMKRRSVPPLVELLACGTNCGKVGEATVKTHPAMQLWDNASCVRC